MPVTRRPCAGPDVQFSRIRFLVCTRYRANECVK